MLEVSPVRTRADLRRFIALPYRLYRGDANFVPPLRLQMRAMLQGRDNMLFGYGPHELLLCRRGRRVIGRVLVGVDHLYNRENGSNSAWFSLFECERDDEAAMALLDAAEKWATEHGVRTLRGPESPDNDDSYKGLLVMGFDGPPALMNSYNPPWYAQWFEAFGLRKYQDLFAYSFTAEDFRAKGIDRVVDYAMAKFRYGVYPLDRKQLDREIRDIHEILVQTMPTFEQEHSSVPSLEDIAKLARTLLPIADDELVCIARTLEGRPIGYVVAVPEWNQVFRHLRGGRLLPFGWLKLLYYRRRIDAMRVFMQFVVPDWQNRAVNAAIFLRMSQAALRKGYRGGDGSTIGEDNLASRLSVEKLGGRHYRTYRLYHKEIIK